MKRVRFIYRWLGLQGGNDYHALMDQDQDPVNQGGSNHDNPDPTCYV